MRNRRATVVSPRRRARLTRYNVNAHYIALGDLCALVAFFRRRMGAVRGQRIQSCAMASHRVRLIDNH